jgi:hypothetical protein
VDLVVAETVAKLGQLQMEQQELTDLVAAVDLAALTMDLLGLGEKDNQVDQEELF